MSLYAGLFLIVAAFFTAALSGVFGMAGGLMLKGAIALVLPVSATFVTHGLLQLVANGWRAILHRRHLAWRIVAIYAAGALAAGLIMAAIAVEPTKATLFLLMGIVPGILWIPQRWMRLDAGRIPDALLCGLSVTGLNLTAATHVFHYDRWWNPAVESQATDRAFRIGQTRTVQVHAFVCAGTESP